MDDGGSNSIFWCRRLVTICMLLCDYMVLFLLKHSYLLWIWWWGDILRSVFQVCLLAEMERRTDLIAFPQVQFSWWRYVWNVCWLYKCSQSEAYIWRLVICRPCESLPTGDRVCPVSSAICAENFSTSTQTNYSVLIDALFSIVLHRFISWCNQRTDHSQSRDLAPNVQLKIRY